MSKLDLPCFTLRPLLCAAVALVAAGHSCAQSAVTAANASVTSEALPVFAGMSTASDPVGSLKKGDPVIVDFEIKTTEKWCSVRLVGQTSKLGFVQCSGLARQQQHFASSGGELTAGGGSVGGAATGPRDGKKIDVAPPKVHKSENGYAEIERQVIHDDVIDINKLAELETVAKSGSPTAMSRAATAHYVAGNFELQRQSPDQALEQFEMALKYAANNRGLQYANLMSIAYIHLRRSEYTEALDYLGRLRKIFPEDPQVGQYTGDAYYALDRIPEAVDEWKRVMKIAPNPFTARSLEKAEKDQATESEFRERGTHHFTVHYQGNATPQLAAEILQTLEAHYRTLQSQLRFEPAEPISVVLYTEETFKDVTRAPGWAGALNDGRLRVPIRGLTSVTDDLSRVLMHELTHSFIGQKTLNRCPNWLNEGLAQYMEPRRSDYSARPLIANYERGNYIPLHHLEGNWSSMPSATASYAYAWALAATETIVARSGMYGLGRFFEHFASETAVEPAMREALQTTYPDLERSTVEYLKETYPQ